MSWPRPRSQPGTEWREDQGPEHTTGSPVPAAEPLQLQLRAVELGQADEEAGERALGEERECGFI